MEIVPPQYIAWEVKDALTERLRLPTEEWMQDWPLEVSDAVRLPEFCDLYEAGQMNPEELFALMQLIVFSLDESLIPLFGHSESELLPERIESLLERDFVRHLHTVKYWMLSDDAYAEDMPDGENGFYVTPMMRRIWGKCFKPEYNCWLNGDALQNETGNTL